MYFYDDYQENIDRVKKRKDIIPILVPNKPPKTNKFNHAITFHKKYPRNKYGTIMKNPDAMCKLEFGSGLTIKELNKIGNTPAKVVLFDWDLTLSMFNGIYTTGDFNQFKFTEDVARFYAGSAERFNALKTMFKKLRDKGTKIYILTNNGWAKYPAHFVTLFQHYDPQMTQHEILFGNQNKLKKINQVFRPAFGRQSFTRKLHN
jgi:hypothetical protein